MPLVILQYLYSLQIKGDSQKKNMSAVQKDMSEVRVSMTVIHVIICDFYNANSFVDLNLSNLIFCISNMT
jgi:hypothetical protein